MFLCFKEAIGAHSYNCMKFHLAYGDTPAASTQIVSISSLSMVSSPFADSWWHQLLISPFLLLLTAWVNCLKRDVLVFFACCTCWRSLTQPYNYNTQLHAATTCSYVQILIAHSDSNSKMHLYTSLTYFTKRQKFEWAMKGQAWGLWEALLAFS